MSNTQASLATLLTHLEPHDGGFRARWCGTLLESAFQPVLSITHQRVVGYEALLRVAEAHAGAPSGNIGPATLFVQATPEAARELDELARCLHLANFTAQGVATGWLFLNSLPRPTPGDWPTQAAIDDLCRHFAFPHERVVIEVLEQRAGDEPAAFLEARPPPGARDFLVALDDFGAGFSNFDRVWRYRPDIVKLDRSLVQRAANDGNHTVSFIAHLVSILHHAGAMVLAEGVETENELMVLMEADVDLVQGFWFGQPHASVREASASAPALAQTMWQRFADYQRRSRLHERVDPGEITQVMLRGARVLASGGTLEAAAAAIFESANALRVFAANDAGEQHAPSIAAPGIGPPPRLAPLYPDTNSNWSRREYFRRALAAPGRVTVMGPHYSLHDGALCYTAAIALDYAGATHVLCADFPPALTLREPLQP